MKMNINIKSLTLSVALCLLFVVVILSEIGIFISGPKNYYEDKVTSQINTIKESYQDITDINRHVFSYIIYSGQMGNEVLWFNENGLLLTKRDVNVIDKEKALLQAKEMGIESEQVSLGYGYDNPVYVVENEQVEVYLDVDTMKQVFYRKKV